MLSVALDSGMSVAVFVYTILIAVSNPALAPTGLLSPADAPDYYCHGATYDS